MARTLTSSLLTILSSRSPCPQEGNGLLVPAWAGMNFMMMGNRELSGDIHQNTKNRMGKQNSRKKSKIPPKLKNSQ